MNSRPLLLASITLAFCVLAQTGQARAAISDLQCPDTSASSAEFEKIRDVLIAAPRSEASEFFARCYAQGPTPACFQPVREATEQALAVDSSLDPLIGDEPKRQPPQELLESFNSTEWSFSFRENVEQIAKDMGWPAVRYKSRHAGGFDRDTSSLLMIRIPGASLKPAVNYDRYLNIPLPADEAEHALTPTPQVPFPTQDDYKLEGEFRKNMPKVFTIVTLEKPEPGGRPKVYFQMFRRRGRSGDARFSPDANQSVRACISCHPNGLRAISPLGFHVRAGEKQLDPVEWLKVEEMNLAMERDEKTLVRYQAPDWRGFKNGDGVERKFLVPAGYGPIYGPFEPLSKQATVNTSGNTVISRPTRTKDFIIGADGKSGCAYSRTSWAITDIFGRAPGAGNIYEMNRERPVRWQKIRDAMKCSECHDHNARGGLNGQTDFSQIAFKVLVDQSMPPQSHKDPMEQVHPITKVRDPNKPVIDDLTGDERIALTNCLQKEYTDYERTQMEAWLKRKSCDR